MQNAPSVDGIEAAMNHRQELLKLMKQASYEHTVYDVFRDFCELSAIAISNAVDWPQRDEREKTYLERIKRYDAATVALFPKMLGCVVDELEVGMADVLGSVYMELEISNKHTGQFFTPYSLCKTIAAMQIDDTLKAQVAERGFITVNEPACGGGAMVIAFAEEIRLAGMNPKTQMHVVAQDVDPRSAHMTYIQLALLHIPAVVLVGNTLTLEVSSEWFTPAHIMGGWSRKLRAREDSLQVSKQEAAVVPVEICKQTAGQIALFGEAA